MEEWRRKTGGGKLEEEKSGNWGLDEMKFRRYKNGGGRVEEENWWRKTGGGKLEEEKWRKNGGGKMEEGEWRRKTGGGKLEEENWRRKSGGGRVEEEEWRKTGVVRNRVGKVIKPGLKKNGFYYRVFSVFLGFFQIFWKKADKNCEI